MGTTLLIALYVVAAACELVGVLIVKEIVSQDPQDEHILVFQVGSKRPTYALLLLAIGIFLGLLGNVWSTLGP